MLSRDYNCHEYERRVDWVKFSLDLVTADGYKQMNGVEFLLFGNGETKM